jgi:nucleoid-associated protein YgaU
MSILATDSKYKKALIQVLDGKGNKTDEVGVLFNPTEYSLEKGNEFANINIPGLESPLLQFVRGGLGTLSMDLFFDSYEEGKDVRDYTGKITKLLRVEKELHAPPIVRFVWGKLIFTAVISRITQKFTMFLGDGVPVRATLSVTFNEYATEFSQKEKVLNSRDRTKHYVLKEGDSLWLIAEKEYGDAAQWRAIATANKIINPRIMTPGREIVVPPIE